MKMLLITMGWFALTQSGFAKETRLDVAAWAEKLGESYALAGRDVNILDIQGELQYDPQIHRIRKIATETDLKSTLADCVFIRRGVSGEHINEGEQAKLVRKFARKLWIHRDRLEFSHIDHADLGSVIHNHCALSIKHDGTYTTLQGSASP